MEIEINKVYNIDCIELMKEMERQGIKVDCVITDPPYNVNLMPQRGTHKAILNDNLSESEFYEFLLKYFEYCYKILNNNTFLMTFMGWQTIPIFNKILKETGFTIKSMPIWVKNNFGIGYYTRPQYEPMYLCLKGNPKPPEHAISDIIKSNKVMETIHSCEKPVDLICKLLNTFTNKNDLVFDGFMGSFTTAVACYKLNRRFIGAELDKEYFEKGSKRLADVQAQLSIFDL